MCQMTFFACDVMKRLQMSRCPNVLDFGTSIQRYAQLELIWRHTKKRFHMQNTITFINLCTFLLPINYRYILNNT